MKIRYYVEFIFMPRLLFNDPEEFIEKVIQDQKYGMTKIYNFLCKQEGLQNRYSDKDFQLTSQAFLDKKLGENIIFRISMPEKEIEAPFCRDVVVTYCSSTGIFRYLTLEYKDENTNCLGEVLSDGSHENWGVAPKKEEDLMKKIKEIAFGELSEGATIEAIDKQNMTIRNAVEYILLPERFFNDRASMLQDFNDIGTDVIVYSYEFAAKKMGVLCPYQAEDFQIHMVEVDNKNGKFMMVLDMPRFGMQEKDALQVIMTMDYPNDSMKYFILEFSGTTQLYLYEILSTDATYVCHGEVPKNPNEIVSMVKEIAFS